MKRKIMSIIVIFALILGISGIKVNAATKACKVTLNPKSSSVAPGKTIDIAVNISNITDTDGLAAYSAKIGFDSNIFTYKKTKGSGEWETPLYNEGNITATVSNGIGQTTNQTIAVITLNVNSDVADGQYEVTLSDITVSNGIDTLPVASVTTKVNVSKTTASDNTNNNNNDNNKNDNNKKDNNKNDNKNNNNNNNKSNKSNTTKNTSKNAKDTTTTSPKKIPYAGVGGIIIPTIGIIAIIGGISYYNYKKIKKI